MHLKRIEMVNFWLIASCFWGITIIKKWIKIARMEDLSSSDDDYFILLVLLFVFVVHCGLVFESKYPLWIW